MTQKGRTYADVISENRKIIIFFVAIILIIIIILIQSKTYFKIGSFEVGSNTDTNNDSMKYNKKVEIKGNQNINGNNNMLINNSYQQNVNENIKEYSIIGTSNKKLINQILKKKQSDLYQIRIMLFK